MTKTPLPGGVKTRLRPILPDEQCAELSKCFLLDTVAKTERLFANIVIAFTPANSGNDIETLLGGNYTFIPQSGSDLGERLEAAVDEAGKQGFGPLVVIGTDSPTLPVNYVQSAFEHLTTNANSVAIGPTDDGGYYLIGISRPQRGLFRNISWSTDLAFEQTIANAREIPGVKILELPPWYDVDEPNDLMRLSTELDKDENARIIAPETFRWLAGNTLMRTT